MSPSSAGGSTGRPFSSAARPTITEFRAARIAARPAHPCLNHAVGTVRANRPREDALGAAWGDVPADLPDLSIVARGEAGPVLAAIASGRGDLLVAGAGHRSALAPDRVRPSPAKCATACSGGGSGTGH
jgi:hypothetical protein